MTEPYEQEYTYRPDIVIFDRLFRLRVPNVYAIERAQGYMTVVEDTELDKQHMLKHVVVMWNIADICEHQSKGRPFNLIKRQDIQLIYQLIREYLEAWVIETDRELINKSVGPYEDLVKLDKLAHHLFDEYKLYLSQGLMRAETDQALTVQDTLDAIFHRKNIAERKELEYDDKYTKYFTKRLFVTRSQDEGSNALKRKKFK